MMSKHQYLLTKLAGEASEIAHIALKAAEFGPFERYHLLEQNNLERIEAEFNDLLGILKLMEDEGLTISRDEQQVIDKCAKVAHYYEYSKALGMVV